MPFALVLGDDKAYELNNKIMISKAKPTYNKGQMFVGVDIDTDTGKVDCILPRDCAPDTIGRNMNIASQIESKYKLKLKLQKKLLERQMKK